MLRESCDELEADLQERGMWLGDLWTGRLTVRRVAVIASQLPPGARVWQTDLSDASWTATDYWLARIVDELAENSWLISNWGAKESDRSARPKPVDRPADAREKRAKQAKLEINALKFRKAFREAHGGD